MTRLSRHGRYRLLAVAVLIGAGSVASVSAQEASPASPIEIDRPAYLQAGTCVQPGDPIAALAETSTGPDEPPRTDLDAAPVSGGLQVPAAVSVTDVEIPMSDLLTRRAIVRVVASEAAPESTIACGAIGGEPDEDGNLYLALTGSGGSNVAGVVWLQEDGDRTTITLFLIPSVPDTTSSSSRPEQAGRVILRDTVGRISGTRPTDDLK